MMEDDESENNYSIDSYDLCRNVKIRPVLWDKSHKLYKDRHATQIAWNEVCLELLPIFIALDPKGRSAYAKEVSRRWANLRDSFSKYKKKLSKLKASGSRKKHKKYVYYEEMKFLNKFYGEPDENDIIPMRNFKYEDSFIMSNTPNTKIVRSDTINIDFTNDEETPDEAGTISSKGNDEKLINKMEILNETENPDVPGVGILKTEEIYLDDVDMTIPKETGEHNGERKTIKRTERNKSDSISAFLQSLMLHLHTFNPLEFLQFQMLSLRAIDSILQKRERNQLFSQPESSDDTQSYRLHPGILHQTRRNLLHSLNRPSLDRENKNGKLCPERTVMLNIDKFLSAFVEKTKNAHSSSGKIVQPSAATHSKDSVPFENDDNSVSGTSSINSDDFET